MTGACMLIMRAKLGGAYTDWKKTMIQRAPRTHAPHAHAFADICTVAQHACLCGGVP